jgi:hypothetical protein
MKWLELPCELTNLLTREATFETIEDRIALALINKASWRMYPLSKKFLICLLPLN